jgi:single-stranded-DNA-specific exonuclease
MLLLKECNDLLLEYGGHRHAAGLTLKAENIPEFRERIDSLAREKITDDMLHHENLVDTEISFNELSPMLINSLNIPLLHSAMAMISQPF